MSKLNNRIYIRVASEQKEEITTYCTQQKTTISKIFRDCFKKTINKSRESFNKEKTETLIK